MTCYVPEYLILGTRVTKIIVAMCVADLTLKRAVCAVRVA